MQREQAGQPPRLRFVISQGFPFSRGSAEPAAVRVPDGLRAPLHLK
jgi:hypothetical protein